MEVKAVKEEKAVVSGAKEDIEELKDRKQQTKNQDVLCIFGICFLLRSFYQIKGSIIVIDL